MARPNRSTPNLQFNGHGPSNYEEHEPNQITGIKTHFVGEGETDRERGSGMGREVSESCVESLLIEMVSSYCNRFYANKPDLAARRIEAIGYQVGHQLSERYILYNTNKALL